MKQIQLIKQQEQQNKTIRNCEVCNKIFYVKFPSIKKKLCSRECYYTYRTNVYECKGCGVSFNSTRYKPIFCSQRCYMDHKYLTRTNFRYDSFYYCDLCLCWIKQDNAIIINNKPTCHKVSCSHNRLRMNAAKAKFNIKRQNIKYID